MEHFQLYSALILAIAFILVMPRLVSMHPFFLLLVAAVLFSVVAGMDAWTVLQALQSGFGGMMQQIGLVVVLGTVMGTWLEKSGAIETISGQFLQWFGSSRARLSLTLTGALVGIPVFCDAGFIVLSRLIPALARRCQQTATPLSLGLAGGLYTTHTLVPPTPGPLAAAANAGLANHMGLVIGMGLICAVPALMVGYWFSGRVQEAEMISDETPQQTPAKFPGVWSSFAPIAIPIVLIAGATVAKLLFPGAESVPALVTLLGTPVVALAIGTLLALLLVRSESGVVVQGWTAEALKDAGVILLITGAGGAFGSVIKASALAQVLEGLAFDGSQGIVLLVAGYLLGALLKTAQGSTTTAMIITSSLLAPLSSAVLTTPYQLTLLVMSIGAGAMTVSHGNDSYFWVISRFGKIHERKLLSTFTVQTFLQGLAVWMFCLVLYQFA